MRALDRLDEALLPRLRHRPEVLLVVAAAVFLGGTAVHADRYDDLRAPVASSPEPAPPPADPARDEPTLVAERSPDDPRAPLGTTGAVVGPAAGADPDAYAEERWAALARFAAEEPGAVTGAIVTLAGLVPVSQAADAVAGGDLRVVAVRYRVPVEGAAYGRVPVDGPVPAPMAAVLRAEAESVRADIAELEGLLATADDAEFSAAFAADRDALLPVAAALEDGTSACVYALEVEGPLAGLAALAEHPDVRLVDPAPPGVPAARVTFLALPPA